MTTARSAGPFSSCGVLYAARVYDLPRRVEMEFRDGKFLVPDHLVAAFKRLETHRMTYAQAIEAANQGMLSDYISAQGGKAVSAHFGRRG